MISIVHDILSARVKSYATFPGSGTLQDRINYGFSFVECEDHMVTAIVVNASTMGQILKTCSDTVFDPKGESYGQVLTAQLYLHRNLPDGRIIFSNIDASTVLVLDPNQEGGMRNASL